MARDLVCPRCGSKDLGTIEDITGVAGGSACIAGGQREFNHDGYTEVYWDSSTTTGVQCNSCYWDHQGDDWLEQLKVGDLCER